MKKDITKQAFIFILSIFFITQLQAQAPFEKWCFGQYCGLDFSGGNPQPFNGVPMITDESAASISDTSGNLLFYSDGNKVWNRNHQQMPGGSGLLGDISSTQGTLIVRQPGSDSIYYLFTCDADGYTNGLNYHIIDMSLQNGLGDVTMINQQMLVPVTEKITAIPHCNGSDYWIVSHEYNSDRFFVWQLSSQGLSATPVISATGSVHTNSSGYSHGQMKASPDHKKIALVVQELDLYEIFDFDNASGNISFWAGSQPGSFSTCYGLAFSPDGSKLYITQAPPVHLWQLDLSSGNPSVVTASLTPVASSAQGGIGSIQLGPDGKIYYSRYGTQALSVISQPNNSASSCGFLDLVIPVSSAGVALFGLPNNYHLQPNYRMEEPEISVNLACVNDSVLFATQQADAVNWDFGDPNSGTQNNSSSSSPSHLFSSAGTYDVTLVMQRGCRSDTVNARVTVADCPQTDAFFPNVITPNGDGLNDVFDIGAKGWSLEIFDRWGRSIFRSGDYQNDFGGKDFSDGVYYYIASRNALNGSKTKGFFHLLKGQ